MSIGDIMTEKSHAVQILGVSFSTTSTLTSSAGVNARMSQGRFTDEESIAPVATGLKRLREEVLPVASSCAVIETAQRSVGILLVLVCVMRGAGAQVHPSEPAVNLGDTSFLDAVAGPGLLIEEIGDGSHEGKVTNGTGASVVNAPGIHAVSGLTHIAWLSKHRMLGGWYGVEVVTVVAHTNAGSNGAVGGWGNLTVSPLILQWKQRTIGPIGIVQRFVLDFELPVGEYRRDLPVSLSSNTLTVHPYYAVTLFPAKRLETSWRVHYLWNGTNNAPPFATTARSTQAGQAIHFNATAGYKCAHGVWIGANAYYLKEVTDPKIDGVRLPNSPEQVGAIGPGAVWDLGRCLLYANAYREFNAQNRPEGRKIVLRVQWIVGK